MPSLRGSWNKWKSRADRTTPSMRQALGWLCFAVIALAIGAVFPGEAWMSYVLFIIFAAAVVVDFIRGRRIRVVELSRGVASRPQIGLPLPVTLTVTFAGLPAGRDVIRDLTFDLGEPASVRVTQSVMLSHSEASRVSDLHQVSKGNTFTRVYDAELTSTRRGRVTLEPVDCRYASPLGLWTRMHRSEERAREVLVLPDVTTWRNPVASLTQTLTQEGRHVKRLASGDTDFAYIAEYTPDDDLRSVNWAATARRTRLMKNVYEPERGQHIIIAVDASRYMGVQLPDGKTRLDHAVDCATALTHAAMQVGDSVGVIGFTSEIRLRINPEKGSRHFRSIVEGLAGLEAEPVQGGYQALFSSLSGRFRRRSLLIVLSEMEGLATDVDFLPALAAARRQHPTLFVTLSPVHLQELLEEPPRNTGDTAKWASVEWLLQERDNLHSVLHRGGVELIEAPPTHLVTRAVTSYLKRRQRGVL